MSIYDAGHRRGENAIQTVLNYRMDTSAYARTFVAVLLWGCVLKDSITS
jgi:hypothetical protein